jgi:hypothetical protein
MNGWKLAPFGADILRKGGHDDASDDDMLIMEIVKRAPGLSKEELQQVFVACRLEYGEDALAAIKSGHVKFEPHSF